MNLAKEDGPDEDVIPDEFADVDVETVEDMSDDDSEDPSEFGSDEVDTDEVPYQPTQANTGELGGPVLPSWSPLGPS